MAGQVLIGWAVFNVAVSLLSGNMGEIEGDKGVY